MVIEICARWNKIESIYTPELERMHLDRIQMEGVEYFYKFNSVSVRIIY